MLELTWCLPGEAAGHVSLVCSVLVAERAVPLCPTRAPVSQAEVTVHSLRLQWVPGSDSPPPSSTSLCMCESCPGESSRPTPHPSTTRPKPVLLKGTQRQARPPQGTEEGICVDQRHTRTAELSSPSAHSLYQGPGLPPPGAALASALGLSSGHALCMSCAYPRSQRWMRHR